MCLPPVCCISFHQQLCLCVCVHVIGSVCLFLNYSIVVEGENWAAVGISLETKWSRKAVKLTFVKLNMDHRNNWWRTFPKWNRKAESKKKKICCHSPISFLRWRGDAVSLAGYCESMLSDWEGSTWLRSIHQSGAESRKPGQQSNTRSLKSTGQPVLCTHHVAASTFIHFRSISHYLPDLTFQGI